MKELVIIQSKLNAPKGQFNKFGGYAYRSCEDILSALKPLLKENNCILTLCDEIVPVMGRIYVKACATITNAGGQSISTCAYAREEETKKGMDGSQITGASSSYARKYALNGLFAIDDTKDADATNDGKDTKQQKPAPAPAPAPASPMKKRLAKGTKAWVNCVEKLRSGAVLKADIFKYYDITEEMFNDLAEEALTGE